MVVLGTSVRATVIRPATMRLRSLRRRSLYWLCSGMSLAVASCAPGFRTSVPRGPEVHCDGKLGSGGVRVSYSRSACDGHCPVYEVTLCNDGTAIYDGMVFVKAPGRKVRVLSAPRLAALWAALDRVADGPGPLEDFIGEVRPHLRYEKNGVTHWLARTTPDGTDTYELFERALGLEEWVGSQAERERLWSGSR